jgi:guanylate kinase
MTNKIKGNLFIISAASGAGKTSLVKDILLSNEDIILSISHTTRKPRPGEINGKDYFFVKENTFNQMEKEGRFLESARCHGELYGTSLDFVKQAQDIRKDIIFEVDWQGADSIKKFFKNAISIFILPPSLKKLEERLKARGQDSEDTIKARLSEAKSEMSHIEKFDYVIINDKFNDALEDIKVIIMAENLKTKNQMIHHNQLIEKLTK